MNFDKSNQGSIVPFLTQEELDALIIHILFGILSVLTLWIPISISQGLRISSLILSYIVVIPLVSKIRNYPEWMRLWFFSVVLSVFQFLPDLFLASQLEVLVFPEDGFIQIYNSVSIYMFGLWTIPIFMILFLGTRIHLRSSKKHAYFLVGFSSFLIFGLSEQFLNFLWYAENVIKLGNVALYIVIPEIVLGLSTYWIYLHLRDSHILSKIVCIFQIMILYLGNAAFFYYLVEKIIL